MSEHWIRLAHEVLDGRSLMRDDALGVLRAPDDEILQLLHAAWIVRRFFFGRKVNLHILCNAKSGLCGEDCAFCSQSAVSTAAIPRYSMKTVDVIVLEGCEAARLGAAKYCIVTSGRSPDAADLETLEQALRILKARHPLMQLCVSPGLLNEDDARRLKSAGADRINHNLETSRRYFPRICTTHTYEERLQTIVNAKKVGLEICSGGLIGMGETLEDRVDLALTLKDVGVHSIPVNFLTPREGTPFADRLRLRPVECLKTLAMFRLVHPNVDIRAAGGREMNLGSLQPLALYAATSIFTQGYLTTPGQGYNTDCAMIQDAGFEIGSVEA